MEELSQTPGDEGESKGERFGKFLLIDKIGEGGMAEVFRARTAWVEGFARQVCLKRILPPLSADQNLRKMFVQEARVAASLTHANIVPVYEFGVVDEYYFLSMEFVDGYTLRDIMMQSVRRKSWLDIALCLHIVSEALEGLDYAHRKRGDDGGPLGIVHRDMTPGNVMSSVEGEVKILDFGIALLGSATSAPSAPVGRGKPGYMAPEQAVGMAVDARADIFSVGVMLFEMLTHRRLFKNKDVAKTTVPAPSRLEPSLPPSLDALVLRALAPTPSERYQSAAAFRDALVDYMHENGLRAGRSTLARALAGLFEHEVRASRPKSSYEPLAARRPPPRPRRRTSSTGVKVGDARLDIGGDGAKSGGAAWLITLVTLLSLGAGAAVYWFVLR